MSNVFVDGFSTYGVGTIPTNPSDPRRLAILSGRYASFFYLSQYANIGTLPWAVSNPDLYLSSQTHANDNALGGARIALPAASTTVICSFYGAVDSLPSIGSTAFLMWSDSNNNPLCGLGLSSTGALFIYRANYNYYGGSVPPYSEVIASTNGPVMTAQSAAHVEMQLVCGTSGLNSVVVQVNGVTVINATGLTLSWNPVSGYPNPNINPAAQLTILPDATCLACSAFPRTYIGNLIVRDNTGTVNNGIVGDRRVATLFVNGDDGAHQGWTGEPIKRFGTGVLDLTANSLTGNAMVYAAPAAAFDIGSGQFTVEGSFRFQGLPTSSNKAVLYAHWDELNAKRECEMYVGGPTLEGGNLVFRVSTDGTGATVTEVISWPVQFVIGHWYHIAVTRDVSNNTRLFINGVQQSLPTADARTYFAGGATGASAALGANTSGTNVNPNTTFAGWVDEFRLTVGVCRYAANFAPPVAAFPRLLINDPSWASVVWISSFDTGTAVDESSYARALGPVGPVVGFLPTDGAYNFQTLNKGVPPFDNSFIEAALIAAQATLTYSVLPVNNGTITVGTKTGPTAAIYTWKTVLTGAAFEVLIGATVVASLSNLVAAINAGTGAGTLYGTGTTANLGVLGAPLGATGITATALVPGAAGNAIACSSTDAGGTWGGATLTGGIDIPAYSDFTYSKLPSNVTLVDSITILTRSWKTDAGVCTVRTSLVGAGGGLANGANVAVTTVPAFYATLIEADPDTTGPITPTTVTGGKIKVDRTA